MCWIRVALSVACTLMLAFSNVCGVTLPSERTNAFETLDISKEFRVQVLTTENGLPQNTVLSLCQSSDGYLWVGTLDGLLRYDGVKFTLFDKKNTPLFKNQAVLAIAENPAGCMWIGTPQGLLKYSHHQFEFLSLAATPVGVHSICPRKAGGLWLGTDVGPAILEDGRFHLFTNYPSYHETRGGLVGQFKGVEVVAEDPTGTLWVGDDRGVLRLRPGQNAFEVVYAPDALPVILKITCDSEGGVWFGDNAGLYRWSDQNFVHFPSRANGFGNERLDPLCWDSRFGLLVRSWNGHLSLLKDSRFVHYSDKDPASVQDALRCACTDREGNIWAGTARTGLHLMQRHVVKTLTSVDGLVNDDVWSISEGPNGTVWIGTDNGLSLYRDEHFRSYEIPPLYTVNDNRFHEVLAAGSGSVWTSSGRGLLHIREGKLEEVNDQCNGQLARLFVGSFYQDPKGTIWASANGTIWRLNNERWDCWDRYSQSDPTAPFHLPGPAEFGIVQDAFGNMWVGVKGGVCRLGGDRTYFFSQTNGLPVDKAAPALAEPDSTVWFASERGLIRFRENRFSLITEEEGLFEDLIYNVVEDDFGWLWLNGNRGIQKVRTEEANALAEGKLKRLRCVHYGIADGMLSTEGNGGSFPNSCKTKDGRLWFPTTKGVVVFDPRTLEDDAVPPPVVIEQVVADGEIVFGDKLARASPVHLSHDSGVRKQQGDKTRSSQSKAGRPVNLEPGRARSLLIHYTANSFIAPEKIRFQYRLAGHDAGWQEDRSNLRTAIYTDLRPGKYLFSVKAFNKSGVPSAEQAEFSFWLAPHFYETWPFYLFCAATVLLLGVSAHQFRLAGVRRIKELEQLHALDQERSRIAQDMHDSLGADLSRIAMLAEMVQRQGASGEIPQTQLERVSGLARNLVHGIGELVWATNPRNNTLDSLSAYIREYASELLESIGVRVTFEFPEPASATALSGETRRHLFLAAKEVLNNIAKHAGPTEVKVQLTSSDSEVVLTIRDNGRGFDPDSTNKSNGSRHGNGLRNLRERLASIGGQADIRSEAGRGTSVRLTVPLQPEEFHTVA